MNHKLDTKLDNKSNMLVNTQLHAVKTLYLLRHGALTKSGILCGHTDIPVSENGWQQLVDATHSLANITQCYSSSLIRCSRFAEHYAKQHNIPLSIDNRLKEMNFGEWDGLPYKTLWDAPDLSNIAGSPKAQANKAPPPSSAHISHFWNNPWECPPPQGESMLEFSSRINAVWAEICATAFLPELASKSSSQGDILVVSHGGVIKHLLATLLQIPLSGSSHLSTLDVKYGALIKVTLFNDGTKIWPQVIFE